MSGNNGGGRLAGALLYLLVISLVCTSFTGCLLGGGVFLMLHQVKAEDPEAYREFSRDVLGVSPSSVPAEYFLTEEGRRLAEAAGLDPDLLARALFVEQWADEQWGEEFGDWSVYYALTGGESGDCQNCGRCLAMAEYRKHAILSVTTQGAALRKLVEIWKKHDIRASNPIAAQYIPEDYNIEGIIGSCGGGALGCSQFIPTTAIIHLEEIGEPFDLWNPDTAMQLMAAELHRLGWQENLSLVEKVSVLLGWNRHRSWVSSIAQSAQNLWATAGQFAGQLQVRKSYEDSFSNPEDLKIGLLGFLGLMPEVKGNAFATGEAVQAGDWQLPVKRNGKYPILSSDSKDHAMRCAIQYAWDFTAPYGTSVFPAGAGTVVIASCGNEHGYGCWVEIDHGGGIHTRYGHMISGSIQVAVGEEVTKETVLGQIGWTGVTSFGPHTHFEFLKNGVRVEPANFFGTPEELGLVYQKFAGAQ